MSKQYQVRACDNQAGEKNRKQNAANCQKVAPGRLLYSVFNNACCMSLTQFLSPG